jgi:hypothetical protein
MRLRPFCCYGNGAKYQDVLKGDRGYRLNLLMKFIKVAVPILI